MSLYQSISSEYYAGVDPQRVAQCFRQLVDCVRKLHAAGIVHCDIKPRNVLLMSDGHLLLCDMDAALPVGAVRPPAQKLSTGLAASCGAAFGAASAHTTRTGAAATATSRPACACPTQPTPPR